MEVPADASWLWRGVLMVRKIVLPLAFCRYGANNSLSFWHSPWSGNGVILSNLLSFCQIYQSGIPLKAKVYDYCFNGVITLPYNSNPQNRAFWNCISEVGAAVSVDRYVWGPKRKKHSIATMYYDLIQDAGYAEFAWST